MREGERKERAREKKGQGDVRKKLDHLKHGLMNHIGRRMDSYSRRKMVAKTNHP